MKTCKKCGESKPLEGFAKNKKMKDGHLSICKPCAANSAREYYYANKEACLAKNRKWMQENKEKRKEYRKQYRKENVSVIAAWYASHPEYNKRYYSEHRGRIRAQGNAYKEKNRDSINEKQRDAYKKNPMIFKLNARAQYSKRRRAGPGYKRHDVEALLKLQKGMCAICRRKVFQRFHVDHIMPIKLGGTNIRANLQILCPPCNLQKGARHPEEFMQSRGFLF